VSSGFKEGTKSIIRVVKVLKFRFAILFTKKNRCLRIPGCYSPCLVQSISDLVQLWLSTTTMKSTICYISFILIFLSRNIQAQDLDSIQVIDGVKSYGINKFVNKQPFTFQDSTVTFFLRNWKEAKVVFLSGNFCNWSDKAYPMTKTTNGWIVRVKLPIGKFWYKFIIDGKWKTDSDNLHTEQDAGGEYNSVYYKTNAFFRLPGHGKAKRVYISGGFNNWKPDELRMEKQNSVWQLSLYLSKGNHAYNFIVDGRITSNQKQKVPSNYVMEIADHNRDLYGDNRFVDGTEFALQDSIVTFLLEGHSAAKQVYVCGSWVSWVKDSLPMTKTKRGWERDVKLKPGKYWYKFVVDDAWIKDPNNLIHENNNSYGFDNSVYYKTNTVFNLPGFNSASRVYLIGTFNSWNGTDLPLKKIKSGWQTSVFISGGTHNYAFLVDGIRYLDPSHKVYDRDNYDLVSSVIQVNTAFKSVSYYQASLSIDERLGDNRKIAATLLNIANAYRAIPEHAEAMLYFHKALSYYKQLNDRLAMGDMFLHLAEEVKFFNDPAHELELLKKAVASYTAAKNDIKLGIALTRLGDYNMRIREYYKAIESFKDALTKFPSSSEIETADLLGNIANAYSYTSDRSSHLYFASRALELNKRMESKNGIAENLLVLGHYYRLEMNYGKADSLYHHSLGIYEKQQDNLGIARVKFSLAHVLLAVTDSAAGHVQLTPNYKYERAIKDLRSCLQTFKDHHEVNMEIATLQVLSSVFERAANFGEAHRYYKSYVDAKESRSIADKKITIMLAELNYTAEHIQDSLRFEKELSEGKLHEQLLLATQQQQQLELNRRELALANGEKEVQYLSFLKAQADLENEKLVKQQAQRGRQLQQAQLKQLTQRNAIISLNQQRQWIYGIGGFVLLGLASAYVINRSRLKNLKLKGDLEREIIEQRLKEADFQRKLADISMSALRSQMNPHFIFNCLNSIKYYTVQNDTMAASEYLTKFSKLIRLVLENSRNDRITLSSELAALELYIQMEAMRFKDKLTYSISVEEDVEADYFEIPPLLLQPFVENAIWHGLMHKEEGGKIDVAVSTMTGGSALQIVISDNGIGRKKAAELKNKGSHKHKSYAMQATSERIALINQIYKSNAVINVADLVDSNQQGAGTQITIQIAM
jgi:tetratricopeptide (TPR) repeat protein